MRRTALFSLPEHADEHDRTGGQYKNYVNDLNGGIASILDPGSRNSTEVINATVKELNLTFPAEEEISSGLVMANVKDAVNVRSDASEEASKVGKLYKDCGGTILSVRTVDQDPVRHSDRLGKGRISPVRR